MTEILIVKPSSLGDIVHTLPSAALLREANPKAKIRWLVNTEWMPLLEGNPHVDEVVEFPRRTLSGMLGALRIAPWAKTLRAQCKADLILDYQGLLRSALISKLCRRHHSRVLGLSDAREGARFFYDHVVDVSGTAHAVDRYLALTHVACGMTHTQSLPTLAWPLPPGDPPEGIALNEGYIVLHPFSRGLGKSLTARQIADICRILHDQTIVLVGRSTTAAPSLPGVVDLLNKTTLAQLIWLLRSARFTITVDSGPMHIAAALSENVVSIHTWSDPAKVGPYRKTAWVWSKGQLYQQVAQANPKAHLTINDASALAEFVRALISKKHL